MIKINDRFSMSRTSKGWTVYEHSQGTLKGKVVDRVKNSYHPSMQAAMEHIRDVESGECETLDEILKILRKPI